MLFATENLPYWIFLGLGSALFLITFFGSKTHDASADATRNPSSGPNRAEVLPNDVVPRANNATQSVLPSKPRRPYSPLVLRLALNLTLWGLIGWIVNVIFGLLQGSLPQNLLQVGILSITLIAALALSQSLMSPIGWVITSRRKTDNLDHLVGCTGTVSSDSLRRLQEGTAQINVVDPTGSALTVNAALPDWATIAPQQGDSVTLIERLPDAHLYYAVATDSADQDHWLKQTAAI